MPRGKAVEGISDIDSYVLIKPSYTQAVDISWFDDFTGEFCKKYEYVNELELRWVNSERILIAENQRSTRIQLVIYGVCIWGEDIIPRLPKLKPGRDVVIHAWTIAEQVSEAEVKFRERKSSEGVMAACTWIMKAFLRTGAELVMEREQRYTRDLYCCYELFAKYYPGKAELMYEALDYALNPNDDRERLTEFVKSFGQWLTEEAKSQGLTRIPTI